MTTGEKSHLDRLEDTMVRLDGKFDEHTITDEKRFGRIEKLVCLVLAVIFLPKLGGTDASTLAMHVAGVVTTIL
jgi:hypothetical protein